MVGEGYGVLSFRYVTVANYFSHSFKFGGIETARKKMAEEQSANLNLTLSLKKTIADVYPLNEATGSRRQSVRKNELSAMLNSWKNGKYMKSSLQEQRCNGWYC